MGRRELQREFERLEQESKGRSHRRTEALLDPPKSFVEKLGSLVRAARHPIRAAAMAGAALALAYGVATGSGLIAAMLGAVLGVAGGELLARTRLRLISLVAGLLGLCGLGWWLAHVATEVHAIAATVGPGATLGLSSVLRFFVLALAASGTLRLLAARHKPLLALELAAVAGSVATLFATHREGVIARPLWLSDWAWQNGYDPTDVLLSIGALAVLVLAGLLVAESERRVSIASILALPLLALLAFLVLDVQGVPEPQANSDLGLTEAQMGDPPQSTDQKGEGPNGSGQPQNGQGGGQGQQQQQQQQGGGQGGQQQQQQGGGQGQQQQQQQGGGQGQQQQQQQGGGQGQQQQQQQQQGGGQGQQQQQQGGQGQGQQQQQQQQQEQPDLDQQQSEGNKPAPMAVVLLGDDYTPPSQAFYFRQDAWSQFNGSRLVAPIRPDVDRDVVRSFPTRPIDVPEVPPEALHTEVHAEVVLLAKHAQPFALESPISLEPETNPNPRRFLRAYNFVSRAPEFEIEQMVGRKAGDAKWTQQQWQHYLAGPNDARYREQADKILETLKPEFRDDPFMQALAIKLWMDENLSYSTAERHANVVDPTADFLFGNKIGYCVHFAHAAVYMWRSLGIPARVGTGYHISEDERKGSTIVIRGGDAHAWPELYLEGFGWLVLDIAAQTNLDPPGEPMDEDLSDLLADMARNETDEQAGPDDAPIEQRNFGRDLALSMLGLLAIGLVVLYLAKIWRRLIPRVAGRRALPRVGYRAALDMLADAGQVRHFGETREAFARRVARMAPSLPGLTSMHVAAAMGNPQVPIAERPEFDATFWKKGLASVRGELPLSTPLWRRLLGLLDPTTVLRSR